MIPALTALAFTLWMGYWAQQEYEEQQRPFYVWVQFGILMAIGFSNIVRESTIFLIML
jgi:hypothetical protein